jgi:predicted transporter
LSGGDYLSVFTEPQLDALAMGALRLGNSLGQLLLAIWGLWLFPFGILTIKSGFFPKVLGYLLMMAGVAYVISCVTAIVFPANIDAVSRVVMPLYFGELPIVLWLLVMGAKVPQVEVT